MGGVLNKPAQQGSKLSARAVLARRAVENQRPSKAPTTAGPAPLPHYHPNAPIAVAEEEPEMDPDLLRRISRVEMVKTKVETVTGDSSHLAVMIRQRKDEELLDLQAKERSLVVGRGRLSERDVAAMLESIRHDPVLNNPIEISKKYKIGIHTVAQISTSVKAPQVLSDQEGNLYAI